jgi:opacity protein-like surface antigen
MKKASALLALTLVCASGMYAQDKGTRLGLVVRPSMDWISTTEKGVKNDGSALGFGFGVIADLQLGDNDKYFFSTGAGLNMLSVKTVSTFDSLSFKGTTKLQYVELPITIKLKTAEIGYMTYFGQIGFDAGINVAAKYEPEGGDAVDVADDTNLLRMALVVGGGLEYNFSENTSGLLGLKYSNGFTSINDGDGDKVKLHYFELTAGVLF